MQKEKKVIIIFPDRWLSYSPTVINLSKLLCKDYKVIILTIEEKSYLPDTFDNKENIVVDFVDCRQGFVSRIIRKADLILISLFGRLLRLKFLNKLWLREVLIGYNIGNLFNHFLFCRRLRKIYNPADILIGVDNVGILAAIRFGSAHLLSLEVGKNIFYYFIKWKKVRGLIIQTEERKNYLLPIKYSSTIPTYFVQNAPMLNSSLFDQQKENNYELLYLGTMVVGYNALNVIAESLKYLPAYYRVTFKGPQNEVTEEYFRKQYSFFCASGKIRFDYNYVANSDLPSYLNNFSIGFTLYDLSSLPYKNFNVISCPSGKLFNYYNVGMPVIGNDDIIGLKSVRDFDAGVLVRELTPEAVAKAILSISDSFGTYSSNAKKAAAHFDFAKNAEPFLYSALHVDL